MSKTEWRVSDHNGRAYILEYWEDGVKCAAFDAYPDYVQKRFRVYPRKIFVRGFKIPAGKYIDFIEVKN